MVTNIDPILGVETSSLNIPVYQHEYQQVPVPYNDLLPVPQPPRSLLYPDNVPPTLSHINAMHPTSRQAQTLNTDGNHALLVSDVSGGGGGGLPTITAFSTIWANSVILGPSAKDSNDWTVPDLIYGWDLVYWLANIIDTKEYFGHVEFDIEGFIIGVLPVSAYNPAGLSGVGSPTHSISRTFPFALDPQAFAPFHPAGMRIGFSNYSNVSLVAGHTIFVSNT